LWKTRLTTMSGLLGRWGWNTDMHGNPIAAPVFGGLVHSDAHNASGCDRCDR
jgi:hypothetical protein